MNNRLIKVKKRIIESKLDAALVSSVPNITYLTGFSGFSTDEREAFLLITQNKNYLLTDKRYISEIKEFTKGFEIEQVSSVISYRIALEKLIAKHKIKKLRIEENDLKLSEYKSLLKILSASALIRYGISENRSVKEQTEIESIEKASKLTDKAFNYILTKIKPGITEKELAYDIEFFIKNHGGDLAFPSIIAFGKNSAIPHHKVTNEKPGLKDIILLDFGSKVDNYCSDMTRVVFLGKASEEQKKVYQIVLDAQQKALEYISTHSNDTYYQSDKNKKKIINHKSYILNHELKTSDVDKVAHDYIRKQGYRKNIFHSLGHGVGLEIHEAPRLSPKSKETLKPGMVFTIEPGIYLPGNFGIRIEDLAVLENSRLRLLSKSPKNLIEL